MKKELFQEIEIPEGVEVKIDGALVSVKGSEGELSKKFNFGKVIAEVKENKIVIGNKSSTKREKKMMNTITAHLRNMLKGVTEKFVYELKICSSHFPMTVNIEGNKAVIKNFLGEKKDRTCSIPSGAEVEVKKDIITVKSVDREIAGQAAANFEIATKISGRDKRIFQDGVYIISKAGREI